MAVTAAEVARAVYIVTADGADEALEAALRRDRRGRKRTLSARTYLIGALLTVQCKSNVVARDIHRTLTERIPLELQWELGARWWASIDGAPVQRVLREKHVHAFHDVFAERLNCTAASAPDVAEDELRRRHAALDDITHRLITPTLPDRHSRSYAIDGSGLWAWGKGRRSDARPVAEIDAGVDADSTTSARGAAAEGAPAGGCGAARGAGRQLFDPDAAWGAKTSKDGPREHIYGYELHALARVPDDRADRDAEPSLVEAFTVTPAGRDIVEPSLRIIDRILESGQRIDDLLADRHYSYKLPERWAQELTQRGIRQVVDLHPNDHGARDYNGVRIIAGWAHCPAMPSRLDNIALPAPQASRDEHARAAGLIAEREQWAAERRSAPDASGACRYRCPALAGKVGCPLREGTIEVAVRHGLPVVHHPPDRATAPTACTNSTFSVGGDAQPKVLQRHYWGGHKWRRSYNRRTFVEGYFGNLKNPSTEHVHRGFVRRAGLAAFILAAGTAIAACNLRQLRVWHERTGNGNPDHPLLTIDPPRLGHAEHTAESAEAIARRHQQPKVA